MLFKTNSLLWGHFENQSLKLCHFVIKNVYKTIFRPLRNLEKFLLKDTFIFIEAAYVHQYNFITWLFLVSDLFFHFSTCSIICIPRLYLYFSINPKCLHQYLIQDHILHMVVVYLNLTHTWSFLANIDFFFFF